jgi:hypothetical protein
VWAVACIPALAGCASPAGGVDFADDALAQPARFFTGDNCSHEFVPEDAPKVHIPTGKLDVCITDTGKMGANDGFARNKARFGVGTCYKGMAIENERLHELSLLRIPTGAVALAIV